MERKIQQIVTGYRTSDGAGVSLVRVLGPKTVQAFDPFLMLDSFDSYEPSDYTAGFPMHPHRGIETISFLSAGAMTHRDSLGNSDTVTSGEVQWMTAGSGIMHEEQLPASERMLGLQLWLNMAAKDKMTAPAYHAVKHDQIEEIPIEGGKLRLLAGAYNGHQGYASSYLPLDYYDILLQPGSALTIPTAPERTVFVFTLLGAAFVAGEQVAEKSAVLTTTGDRLTLAAGKEAVELVFASSLPLNEPVAWGGPIVMNTDEELRHAFAELRGGTFLKESVSY